jgi:integrase
MGARLYKEFRRLVWWACEAQELSTDHDLHSIRHGFDTRLKDAGVSEEYRQDLMGHEGKSETSSRYADALTLERGIEVLNKLPILTEHLQPEPIRLLPWVEGKKEAPFSRRRRS